VSRSELAEVLEHARTRTERLLEPLSEDQLAAQDSRLQSPLAWDLAHIANFEELWLVRQQGRAAVAADRDGLYDASAHARSERGELPILAPAAARAYAGDVREAVLELLPSLPLDGPDPLFERGFAVGMVVQHELQHVETMTQTLALAGLPGPSPYGPPRVESGGEAAVPGGTFTLGSTDPWAYDNERPAHEVDLPSFKIDRAPVTNAEYAAFVEAGGYGDRELWSSEGWAWREVEDAVAPLTWQVDGSSYAHRRFDRIEPLPLDEPVQHVSFHEAEAYARWAGKRLPTEPEWEKAVKTVGGELEHVTGAVWQWTSSAFDGYPGFRAFPYAEYSEVFFGDAYRVLRGGSWVTDPLVARPTFRNWDLPQRRQIFSGIRCARDD
jgi:gamma-glutamyl hercynylcysteine S-oxide synthase